jgi:hypothetical protein
MLRDKVADHILRCHHCNAAMSSPAYDVFDPPHLDELCHIQAAHAEEAVKLYHRLEGDKVTVDAESFSNLIAALLDAASLRELDTITIVQDAFEDFYLDTCTIIRTNQKG